MENQLTKPEIEVLFKFVRSKYVRYIDVQYELVDHLATGIENLLALDSNITFDQALERVYGTFPITGFSNIVEQKEKSMSRYWWRKIYGSLNYYLKPLRFMICLLTYFSLLFLVSRFGYGVLIPAMLGIVVLTLHNWLVQSETYASKLADFDNKYLVVKMFRDTTMGSLWMTIAAINLLTSHSLENVFASNWRTNLLTAVILHSFMWIHASVYIFPEMLKRELNTKYRHLNISL